MKLRRAMVVAAATAVIAPAAFLAAPAAYATDGSTDRTTATTGAPGETESTTSEDAATADDASKTEDGAPKTDDGAKGDDTAKTEDGAASGDDSATEDTATTDDAAKTEDDKTPAGTGDQGGSKPGDEAGKDETQTGEEETDEDEIVEEEVCAQAAVDVTLSGLPGKIVAGSGWKNFSLNVKNNSKEDIGEVALGTWASYEKDLDGDHDGLVEKYAKLEYKKSDGQWESGDNLSGQNLGFFFDVVDLKKDENRTIQLRISIDKAAPAGSALGFAVTGYDKGDKCYEDFNAYEFQILAAGSNGGDGGEAKPSDQKPADLKPQGGSTPIKIEGELAETGSSSMLPTIGIAGGIAIVAGAGVVFALKRRNNGATA
ncbi:LPXTG cell wall anchor domain-containing protein [Streptomyces ficellus]|uniref:LPXTG cell wall anchor domain-containing protein n=1 Tax=Streptomyces ficellus TaxID=1977088 RepID=A0ABT7ZCE7_9ACTN|nr:LPXTG cell wall anchor domain-containing protein [Streptomyces ficellus]MDN3296726.1 LPXTG cell wall anchor domain-containing protein [Streptomyces ficellus]